MTKIVFFIPLSKYVITIKQTLMKVALIGYGKMGHEIESILISRGHSVDVVFDVANMGDICTERLKNVDVAIEFSTPEAALNNIIACLKAGVPVVSGTTGWLDKFHEAETICKKHDGAFFYASNYSIGVNLFQEVNIRLAKLMNAFEQYDVTVEETHHTQKKDAPSGTAITLAQEILDSIDRKTTWYQGATIDPKQLGISSVRRSIVPGTHTIIWESEVDSITITHTAKSRRGFALGAVTAAEFIVGRHGVFSMRDLLSLNDK